MTKIHFTYISALKNYQKIIFCRYMKFDYFNEKFRICKLFIYIIIYIIKNRRLCVCLSIHLYFSHFRAEPIAYSQSL